MPVAAPGARRSAGASWPLFSRLPPRPWLLSLCWLAGCAQFGPNSLDVQAPDMPRLPVPAEWRGPDALLGEPTPRWWLGFEDPALERFIDQALRDSSRMGVAFERLKQARLKARREGANRNPEASLSASAGLDQPLRQGSTSSSFSVTGGLSYEVDLWGKLAAARTAAEFEAHATQYDRQAVALALVGEVAIQHWDLSLANEQLVQLDSEVQDIEWMLTIARVRRAAGGVPETEITEIEQLLDSLQLQRLELKRDRANARQTLARLLGIWPEMPVGEGLQVPRHALPELPAGLPASVVQRRPDVRAAEARLRAQILAVDQARAARYPSLSLSAELDASSSRLLKVLSNPVLSLGSGLVVPVLQAQRLQLDLEVSRSEADQASLSYRQTVVDALAEVEAALAERPYLAQRAAMLTQALARADRAEKVARARFEAGVGGALPWLEQRRQRRDAVLALSKGRRDLLVAQMRLYLALGGDTGLAGAVEPPVRDPLDGVPGVAPLRTVILPPDPAKPGSNAGATPLPNTQLGPVKQVRPVPPTPADAPPPDDPPFLPLPTPPTPASAPTPAAPAAPASAATP